MVDAPIENPSAKVPGSRHMLFWSLAVAGCLIDLATKSWTFNRPEQFQGVPWWLWDGHAGIQLSLNEGALFGMGQGKVWLFALFSLVAATAIPIWLFSFRAAADWRLTAALGAIMGGIFGNLYDRLGMHGLRWEQFPHFQKEGTVYAVRDWILWQWNDNWRWPNFNIADVLLVCGAATLFLISLRTESPDETADTTGTSEQT